MALETWQETQDYCSLLEDPLAHAFVYEVLLTPTTLIDDQCR